MKANTKLKKGAFGILMATMISGCMTTWFNQTVAIQDAKYVIAEAVKYQDLWNWKYETALKFAKSFEE